MSAEEKNMEFLILEAAEKLFLEQGFAKTTTAQIAKLAGCNQALVHYYYRTKDNLFEKIFEEKARFIVSNIFTMKSDEGTFQERIARMIGQHFDFLAQNPKLAQFLISEIWSSPQRLQMLLDKLQHYPKSVLPQLENDLKTEIEKGTIRPISVMDLVLTFVSLNFTPFLVTPLLAKVAEMADYDIQEIMQNRKQEVIETVLSRLRK